MSMPASVPVGTAPVSDKRAGWTLQPVPPQPAAEHVGKLFAGRYMLRRKIGGGGMSTIYEAQDTTLGVRVVVKIMRGDLPSPNFSPG
jgi:serine/threonine protein kinase